MNEILNLVSITLSIIIIITLATVVFPKKRKERDTAYYRTVRKSTLSPPRISTNDYDRYLVSKYILPSKRK